MRGWVAFAAITALCAGSDTAFAFSTEYVAQTRNCAGSVEKWVNRHAAGGQKILEQRGTMGAFAAYLIRWNDGTVQEVTIGPANDTDGEPAICVLERRHVAVSGET